MTMIVNHSCEPISVVKPATSTIVMSKPRHPLSAYNLFFQLERRRILKYGIDFPSNKMVPISQNDIQLAVAENRTQKASVAGAKKRTRSHRKSHGKVGFLELAHEISSRWKRVDPILKQRLEAEATIDKQEYAEKIKIWREYQEQQEKEQEHYQAKKQNLEAIITTNENSMHKQDSYTSLSDDSFSTSSTSLSKVLSANFVPTANVQEMNAATMIAQVFCPRNNKPPRQEQEPSLLFQSEAELRQAVHKTVTREKLLNALHTLAKQHGLSQAEALQSLRRNMDSSSSCSSSSNSNNNNHKMAEL